METHKHQIRTQCLELTFENESRVSQWQQRVIDICQRELQQAIETCLNDCCPHNKLIRFKKLEIDMGSIAMEDLQSEWPAKVKEALRQALEDALYQTASSGVEIKSFAHTQLDSIAHYLQFGNLPWNHQPSDVSNLIEHALKQEPLALATLMRTLGVSLSVRTRMVERLGHARLCQLVHLLESNHAKDMIAYHAYLLQLNRKEEMVEAQQNVLEKTLWLFVFNYLLVERDSVFNAKSYARSILQQFAFHFNITYRHLVALIVAGLQKWKGALPLLLVGALHEIEQELNEKSESETNLSKTKGEETSAAPSIEKWLHNLPTDSAIDDDMLVQLLDALKNDKHKAIALGQLLARSHEHMPVRMVRHLVPQEAGRIEAYHQYVMSVHNQQPITQVPQRELKNTVWTLIIAYLLDNQGSYFNQKNFLKTLIHRTAAHYNLSEFMLLEKLLKSERTWKAYPSTIHNFLRIVQEIY
ncbi:MAG: hypothetical protein HOP30_22140, partial [Cyclobacteriaceae bacterium]|nr:hypothetical protein [Cyclobacteriaceae bacterium]